MAKPFEHFLLAFIQGMGDNEARRGLAAVELQLALTNHNHRAQFRSHNGAPQA